jgi:hypothetical protein
MSLPSWITLSSSPFALKASDAGVPGTYTIIVVVTFSSGDSLRYSVTLTCNDSPPASSSELVERIGRSLANLGPPTFSSALVPLVVHPNTFGTYNLPMISDPDNDSWTVKIEPADALPFTIFNMRRNRFTFAP